MSDYEKLEKPTLYKDESNPLQENNNLNYIVTNEDENHKNTLALERINRDLEVRIENKILNEINCEIDKKSFHLSYLIGISEIYKNLRG